MKPKVCVMLAAGLSSRMVQWKMMLPWENGTVLDGALGAALSFCDRVVLVTGFRGTELNWRYGGHSRITLRHNEGFTQGMFSSIRCGVEAIDEGYFFLALGDMPAVSGAVYRALWRQRDATCLVPEYAHGKGHQVLLPPAMREAVLAADDETSMKTLIARHGQRRVPVVDGAIHWDMDTPEQYQQLLLRR